MLSADFGLMDEYFFKCLNITCIFQRTDKKEYCTDQMIYGSIQYANHYLSFIKDNFKFIKENTWEMNYYDTQLKVEANYIKQENKFVVIFRLKEK